MISVDHRAFVLTASAVLIALGAILGVFVVPYGYWVGDNYARIFALPIVLALVLLLIMDKGKLFLLIILLRAAVDPLIDAVDIRFAGLGGALNALMILIGAIFVVQQPKPFLKAVLPIWAPVILAALIAAVRSVETFNAIRSMLVLMSYVAVFTVPMYLGVCRRDLRACAYVVLLSSAIPTVYGFLQLVQGNTIAGRVDSTFAHPNIFAFYLVLTIAITFYLLKVRVASSSLLRKALLFVYIAVLLTLLVLTKTRAAWTACAGVFVVYGILFERRYILYVASAVAVALMIPEIGERLQDVYRGDAFNSYDWRRFLWQSAWAWMTWWDLPLGYGLGSFGYYVFQFFPWAQGPGVGAHNVYLQWLFETGVLGVLCAAWLFLRLLVTLAGGAKNDNLRTVIVLAIIFGYLVASLADNMLDYLPLNWYFWFVVGNAYAITVAECDENKLVAKEPVLFRPQLVR